MVQGNCFYRALELQMVGTISVSSFIKYKCKNKYKFKRALLLEFAFVFPTLLLTESMVSLH